MNLPLAAFPAVWSINVTPKRGIARAAFPDSTMKFCSPPLQGAAHLGWVGLACEGWV